MPYTQSNQYLRNFDKYPYIDMKKVQYQGVQAKLLEYVLTNTPKNDPQAIIQAINDFCKQNWMMNIGEEKGEILLRYLKTSEAKSILELGGYCGFSALLMAANSNAIVHTIEPNEHFASVAHRIHQHAGIDHKIIIHIGILQNLQNFIKDHGKFDFILIDHVKDLYLQDFKELQKLNAIQHGTIIFGDNIIYPGSPDYLDHFKHNDNYESILYHSYLEYSNYPDAVLVSRRITQ